MGGLAAGQRLVNAYNNQCYHQRCDEFDASWDMVAAAQDGALVYALARQVADSPRWPGWNPGVEFGDMRQRTRAQRK